MNKIQIPGGQDEIEKLSSQGKTVIYVLFDGKLVGTVALADIVRPESKEAISRLQSQGIKCMMLTGDNKLVAKWVADEIGLDEYFAEVLLKIFGGPRGITSWPFPGRLEFFISRASF